MADLNDFPGGTGGLSAAIGATAAGIVAAWRMFKAWGPSDRRMEADSSAQIAALDRYEKMLEDERTAHAATASRAAAELVALRDAWAKDVATRSADYSQERAARLASDAKRDEAMQELWKLRGQVQVLEQQLTALQDKVARMGGANGAP